ncbi:XRE family transcriptional regulator [Acinetobacter oleivorans]|uniref:XRE family transcriptional regulator n=1 Tax=Acinetobacter oleivorans TaxID=1148157 RepID=UPI003A8C478B
MLTLYSYWRGLNESERLKFCEEAKVTYGYMETQLIHARKKPRMETIQKMVDASNKKLTHKSLFDFFLGTSKTVSEAANEQSI